MTKLTWNGDISAGFLWRGRNLLPRRIVCIPLFNQSLNSSPVSRLPLHAVVPCDVLLKFSDRFAGQKLSDAPFLAVSGEEGAFVAVIDVVVRGPGRKVVAESATDAAHQKYFLGLVYLELIKQRQ